MSLYQFVREILINWKYIIQNVFSQDDRFEKWKDIIKVHKVPGVIDGAPTSLDERIAQLRRQFKQVCVSRRIKVLCLQYFISAVFIY